MPKIQSVVPLATDIAVSGAGAAVTLTYAAVPGMKHVIYAIHASYSAAPTGGNILVRRGAGPTTVQNIDIVGTNLTLNYEIPISSIHGEQLVITLAGGGGAIVGKISAVHSLSS